MPQGVPLRRRCWHGPIETGFRGSRAAGSRVLAFLELESWYLFGTQTKVFQTQQGGWVGQLYAGHSRDQGAQWGGALLGGQGSIFSGQVWCQGGVRRLRRALAPGRASRAAFVQGRDGLIPKAAVLGPVQHPGVPEESYIQHESGQAVLTAFSHSLGSAETGYCCINRLAVCQINGTGNKCLNAPCNLRQPPLQLRSRARPPRLRVFEGNSPGENAYPADFGPVCGPAAAPSVLVGDSLLGKLGPSLAAARIAHLLLLGTEPGGEPASRSRRVAGGAGALQKYLAPPTPILPSAHRNFQTCSLRFPQGGAMSGLLTLYLFQ